MVIRTVRGVVIRTVGGVVIRTVGGVVIRTVRGVVRMAVRASHHLICELLRLGEEDLICRQVISREQPAQDTDDRLKHADGARAEVEVVCDPLPRLVKLGLHVHDPEVVEAIDEGRAEAQPIMGTVRDGLELVSTPRVPDQGEGGRVRVWVAVAV